MSRPTSKANRLLTTWRNAPWTSAPCLEEIGIRKPRVFYIPGLEIHVTRRGRQVTITLKCPHEMPAREVRETWRTIWDQPWSLPWDHNREQRDGVTWHSAMYRFELRKVTD